MQSSQEFSKFQWFKSSSFTPSLPWWLDGWQFWLICIHVPNLPLVMHVMQWSIRPELVGVQIWWKYDHLPAPRSNTFPLAIRTLGWCFFVGHVFLNRKLGKILTPFGCRTAFCIWVQVHFPLIQNWPNNSSWKYRGLTPLVSTSVLQASYKWSQRARWLCRLWFHSYFLYFHADPWGKWSNLTSIFFQVAWNPN